MKITPSNQVPNAYELFPAFPSSYKNEVVRLDNDSCNLILAYLVKSIFSKIDYTSYKNICVLNKKWKTIFSNFCNLFWQHQFPLYPILKIDTLYTSLLITKPETIKAKAPKKPQKRQLVIAELLRLLWRKEGVAEPQTVFRKRFEAGAELNFIVNFYSDKSEERLKPLLNIFNFFLQKLEEDTKCAYLSGKERSIEKTGHSHPLFIVQRLYSRFKTLETEAPLETSVRDILKANPVQTLLVMRGFAQDRQTLLDNCYVPYLPNETLWNHYLPVVIGNLIQWEALEQLKYPLKTKDLEEEEISYLKYEGAKRQLTNNPNCETPLIKILNEFQLPDSSEDLPAADLASLQIKRLENYFLCQLGCEIPVSILTFLAQSEATLLMAQLTDYFISKGKDPAHVVGLLRISLSLSIFRSQSETVRLRLLDLILKKSMALNLIDSTMVTEITLLGMLCECKAKDLVTIFLDTLKSSQYPFNIDLGENGDNLNTPLHYAAEEPNIWCQLMAAGANPNLVNLMGETPFLNYLGKTKSIDSWYEQLPYISFAPIQGEGLEALRKMIKELIPNGEKQLNFSEKFSTLLKQILNENVHFLNEETYTSLFFASVIFCGDLPVVEIEVENFKNVVEVMNSSEFKAVAGFSSNKHVLFLSEWLECTLEKPISWLAAANVLWHEDCFKGVAETIKNSIFNRIYSNCKSKYSLAEVRPLVLVLNDSRVKLFEKELTKVIKKTNQQHTDLLSWLAKHAQKSLNISLFQTLMGLGAKLDVPKVIDSTKPRLMTLNLLTFLIENVKNLSRKERLLLKGTLSKWRSACREIIESDEKRTLKANIAFLDKQIVEMMSPTGKQKGKTAATPSPLKRKKIETPPDSRSPAEKRKRKGKSMAEPSLVKRRLLFPATPPTEVESSSSSSSTSTTSDLSQFVNFDELFRDLHNIQEDVEKMSPIGKQKGKAADTPSPFTRTQEDTPSDSRSPMEEGKRNTMVVTSRAKRRLVFPTTPPKENESSSSSSSTSSESSQITDFDDLFEKFHNIQEDSDSD